MRIVLIIVRMSTEALKDLKDCIKRYRDVDDELVALNKKVYELRESRRCLSDELTQIIKLPQFDNISKLKIDDDGSTIKIQRPDTYSKAWSLSKKELETLLTSYFQSTANPTSAGCNTYILEQRKASLVGKEFEFYRNIPEE